VTRILRLTLLAVLAGVSTVVFAIPGAFATQDATAGIATVVDPRTGNPLNSGGSATLFALQLPPGAACAGDSAHKGYLLYSYVLSSTVNPATLTYKDGYPATGVDLIDQYGDPWVTKFTAVDTGAVSVGSIFKWSLYGHDTAAIKPGNSYNIGISCSQNFKTASYWNVGMRFLPSATDPAGFTWAVVAPVRGGHPSSSAGLDVVIGVLAGIAVVAAGAAVLLRRGRDRHPQSAEL